METMSWEQVREYQERGFEVFSDGGNYHELKKGQEVIRLCFRSDKHNFDVIANTAKEVSQ